MEKGVHYLLYGSCMDEESFRSTGGEENYEVMGRAILSDYRGWPLHYGAIKWQGGVADVVPSPGDEVEGVLYKLHPSAQAPLDRREGVPLGRYRRLAVEVAWGG